MWDIWHKVTHVGHYPQGVVYWLVLSSPQCLEPSFGLAEFPPWYTLLHRIILSPSKFQLHAVQHKTFYLAHIYQVDQVCIVVFLALSKYHNIIMDANNTRDSVCLSTFETHLVTSQCWRAYTSIWTILSGYWTLWKGWLSVSGGSLDRTKKNFRALAFMYTTAPTISWVISSTVLSLWYSWMMALFKFLSTKQTQTSQLGILGYVAEETKD